MCCSTGVGNATRSGKSCVCTAQCRLDCCIVLAAHCIFSTLKRYTRTIDVNVCSKFG
jgi:hypothetical protein